jgi:hydrogenase nickel incorporation protein HypA/HybF
VSVGLLSGVEPELLGRAYQVLVEASPVRGAALVLEPVPITARCRDCRLESELASLTFECGGCGGHRLEVLRGEDLILESVTMEQEPLPGAEGVGTDRG